MKKLSTAAQILIALALGIIVGILLIPNPQIAVTFISPFGKIFLNLIKFLVVPVVLFSVMGGVLSMRDMKKVGKVGIKVIAFYMVTTIIAVIIGLLISELFKGSYMILPTADLVIDEIKAPSILDTLVNIFPSNIVTPFSEASMLQVIFIALFAGAGINLLGEKSENLRQLSESLNTLFLKLMELILKLSPIGVFCLIAPVVAQNGTGIFGSLAMVLLAAYISYFLHAIITYSVSVKMMAGISPMAFFKAMIPAMVFAFSSASSVGTLPLNMECCEKLGAKKEIAGFTLPLGATINMDGTSIYQGVCTVFIAACYGINLGLSQMLVIVLTAVLASVGTAGVPGSGVIMLSMVLQSVGIPIEGIALVIGIDRLFDMGRTVVNITGDAACTICFSDLKKKA